MKNGTICEIWGSPCGNYCLQEMEAAWYSQDAGKFLRDYTALHPRREQSLLWEPRTSHFDTILQLFICENLSIYYLTIQLNNTYSYTVPSQDNQTTNRNSEMR